jgi:hypothetical protein
MIESVFNSTRPFQMVGPVITGESGRWQATTGLSDDDVSERLELGLHLDRDGRAPVRLRPQDAAEIFHPSPTNYWRNTL